MIWEEPQPGAGGSTKRGVVECDKPGCQESYYVNEVGAYTAALRMQEVGWDVSLEMVHGVTVEGITYASKQAYPARCPEHKGDD